MERTIFISYASADEKVAASVCDALEARGFHCWISYRDVRGGKNYQAAIPLAIRSAKVMVLVFSSHTNASSEVGKELALASKWKLPVIPLRVENVEPEPAFLYELVNRQWIDYFKDREQSLRLLGDEIAGLISPQPGELPSRDALSADAVTSAKATTIIERAAIHVDAITLLSGILGLLGLFSFWVSGVATLVFASICSIAM